MIHTLSCTHTRVDYAQVVIAIGFLINSVHRNVEDSPARCVNIEFYGAFYLGNIVCIRGTALSHGESRIYGSGRETKPSKYESCSKGAFFAEVLQSHLLAMEDSIPRTLLRCIGYLVAGNSPFNRLRWINTCPS